MKAFSKRKIITLILVFLSFWSHSQIPVFTESFETSANTPNISNWNTVCYQLTSFSDNAPGGGVWSLESPTGNTQGCFYQYINKTIPNVLQGDIFEVSGWLRVDSNYATSTYPGIGFGIDDGNWIPTASNISYSNSTSWIRLTAVDTFFLTPGDTAVVILDAGLTGGAVYAQTYFDLIKVVKLGNVFGCDSISLSDTVTVTNSTLNSSYANAVYQWLDCDNNFSIIPGETNQNFTASYNGNYAVEVTLSGCIDTSNCINISDLGINGMIVNQVQIFPNPNDGQVNLELGNLKNVSLKIFTINDQLVFQTENINSTTHQFEFSHPAGIYFIEVNSKGSSKRFKLIKK